MNLKNKKIVVYVVLIIFCVVPIVEGAKVPFESFIATEYTMLMVTSMGIKYASVA